MGVAKKLMAVLLALVLFSSVLLLIIEYKNLNQADNNGVSTNFDINVHFIDVGQGDCSLIESPRGNVLIDAGTSDSRYKIESYVDSLGITEFEYAIFTHPHEDHIGSADYLLEKYNFKKIIMPTAVNSTPIYNSFIDAVEKEGCQVLIARAGANYSIGDIDINIFAPDDSYDTTDLNNMSVVAKVDIGDVSFMFTGDAEEPSEISMCNGGYALDADILKVAHHGSSTSTTDAFLNAVTPEVAIISAGENNDYGHPHAETMSKLNGAKINTYITYTVGSIVVGTDGITYQIVTEK